MNGVEYSLGGRAVVITGGGGLLGARHAQAVAEAGGVPVVLDINDAAANEVARRIKDSYGIPARSFAADVADENNLEEIAERLVNDSGAPPYGLINNAAIDPKFDGKSGKTPVSRLEAFPVEQWEREIRVGLTGAFLCAKVFGKRMAEARRGVIINMASDLGLIAPDQRIYRKEGRAEEEQDVKPVTYSAIKHGVIGLTKYIATYWAQKGVRCNALAPGGVYNGHPPEFVEKLTDLIPLGRMASPDEYKSAVRFLLTDASSYMTGAVLVMDGGRSCW